MEVLPTLAADGPYDLMFIDADKRQLRQLPGLGSGEPAAGRGGGGR